MPKTPSSAEAPDIKPDPYPKESPSKKSSSSGKGVFTEEMDRKIIHHVLKKSDISLRFDWPELVQNEFPGMTAKQVSYGIGRNDIQLSSVAYRSPIPSSVEGSMGL
jgi:hypothetical protein